MFKSISLHHSKIVFLYFKTMKRCQAYWLCQKNAWFIFELGCRCYAIKFVLWYAILFCLVVKIWFRFFFLLKMSLFISIIFSTLVIFFLSLPSLSFSLYCHIFYLWHIVEDISVMITNHLCLLTSVYLNVEAITNYQSNKNAQRNKGECDKINDRKENIDKTV